MKNKKLSILLVLLIIIGYAFSSCAKNTTTAIDTAAEITVSSLKKTQDMGQEYIDSFVFLGESTTYHMKSRGVLKDGTNTQQVWGTKSGTLNLDTTIQSVRIVYPQTGEEITIADALKKSTPEKILLTFGLNGAVQKYQKGKEYFKDCYKALLDTIKTASPHTQIFIQSAFPIAKNIDMKSYTVDSATLNQYIDTINCWSAELALEYQIPFLNTAECLKGEDGYLRHGYQAGDGYHLTVEAYMEILNYIRTHGYTEG